MQVPSIWSKGVRFKVYHLESELNYESLLKELSKSSMNSSTKQDGWLADSPYFKSKDETIFTFVYVKYRSDTPASRQENKNIRIPDFYACTFDLKSNLLIVSTSGKQKLSYVERYAFSNIRSLTNIIGCSYSGSFLFWLAYKYDNESGRVNENILIEDLTALSSESESTNSTDSVRASSEVTDLIESQLILGINRHATAFQLKANYNDLSYKFDLFSDGRFVVKEGTDDTGIEEKIMLAEQIHKLTQECYVEYLDVEKSSYWPASKEKYSLHLLKEVVRRLSEHIKSIEGNE